MSLLDLLSSTVYSLSDKEKEYSDSPNTAFDSNNTTKDKAQVQEILDSKVVEGHRWYLCKFRGMSDSNPVWKKSVDLSCDSLIEEFNEKANQKNTVQEPEAQRKNLDTVKEALRCLGGKAFGGAIVDWICENGHDMLHAYSGDRKKLRYCVNGLLSARVNSSIFEKKVYKENGTTKTEWMLSESYMKTLGDVTNQNPIVRSIPAQKEEVVKQPDSNIASAEDSENSMDDDTSERTATLPEDDDNNSVTIITRSTARQPKARTPKESTYSVDANPYARSFNTRTSRDKRRGALAEKESAYDMEREDYFDISTSVGSNSGMELDSLGAGIEEEDGFFVDGSGVTPQTYRGMIKVALEALHGQGTFEAISKFIGTRFKDQLTNKAETWKHSIAGCLSVYFARRENKDTSGKVVWTLGEPPKPKRRGRKRDRDDASGSPVIESRIHRSESQTNLTRSSSYSTSNMNDHVVPYKPKKKKDDMVMVAADHLEYLEEEVECLKLIVAKRQREEGLSNFYSSNSNINVTSNGLKTRQSLQNQSTQSEMNSCVACNERHELTMMVNPCGHLFCGSVFCDQSTAPRCFICNANITGKLPFRGNRLPANVNTKKPAKDTITSPSSTSSTSTSVTNGSSKTVDPCLTSLSSLASVMSYEIFGDDIYGDRTKNPESTMEMDTK